MIDEKKLIEELYKFADEEIEKSEEMYKAKNFDMLMQHKYGENCFYKAIQKAKDMPKVGEWIPCTERLPEDGEDVLVWFEYYRFGNYNRLYQTTGISFTHNGKWSGFVNNQSGWQQLTILAWMPLPEPYKE